MARLHFSSFPAGQELTTDTIEEVNDFLIHCNTVSYQEK